MSGVLRPAPGTLVFALVVVGPVVALVPRGCLGVAARAAPPRWRSFPLDRGAAVPDRPVNLGRRRAPSGDDLRPGVVPGQPQYRDLRSVRGAGVPPVRRCTKSLRSAIGSARSTWPTAAGAPVHSAMIPRASGLKRHDLLSKPHQ